MQLIKNDFIYLEAFQKHPDAKQNPSLLREYNLSDFDFSAMRNIVVQRVIERAGPMTGMPLTEPIAGETGVKKQ